MQSHRTIALTALVLVAVACSDSAATTTTSTTSTTTTTTLIPTTSSTEAPSTTVEETTTTTTSEPEDTTTTSEGPQETTTTTRVPLTTPTTTPVPADADPDLVRFAGLYRQPTVFTGFLEFDATGIIRAGTSPTDLPIEGRWDYDADADEFIFSDFDFGDGCNGAEGRYARETAFGGGRRITLVDDPCEARVQFLTQPGSTCQCFLYLKVVTE